MHILFVCSGNICRSPFAEAFARRKGGNTYASAGTVAVPGAPATRTAIEVADGMGVDLRAHRAAPLSRPMVAAADVVYCMEAGHVAAVRSFGPGAKVALLDPNGEGIPDPYGGDPAAYAASYSLISEALSRRWAEPA